MSNIYSYKNKTDYVRLSSEGQPENPAEGSTLYYVDNGKFFIYYQGSWYEQ